MRGLGGFVLLAGIGVGLFVYFPAPVDRDTSLEQAKRVVAERIAPREARKTFAPSRATHGRCLAPCQLLARGSSRRSAAQSRIAAAPTAPPLAAAAKIEPVPSWQTNVVPTAGVGGPPGSLDPTDPESRYKLVVDIQQQLKRVGCYWGRTNGAWNNNTREAMQDVHGRTPTPRCPSSKPDYLLLSLLQIAQRPLVRHARDDDRRGAARAARTKPSPPPSRKCCRGRRGPAAQGRNAPLHAAAEQRRLGGAAAGPHGDRRPEELPPAAQAPLIPGGHRTAQVSRMSLPLRSTRAPPAPASVSPAAAPKPRQACKKSRAQRARARRATISC